MSSYKITNQLVVTLIANIGALIFGINLGWSAPASETVINNSDYYFLVNSTEFGFVVAATALGGAISSTFSGFLRKAIGTRFSVCLFGLPIILGYVLITIPLNLAMLIAGRFLIGLSMGCYSYILPMFTGEIASNEIRGALLSVFQLMVNFGILLVFVIGHYTPLRTLNIICGFIPLVYSMLILFLPESPPVLISKNREEDAVNSIKILRGKSYNYMPEIDDLKIRHQEISSQKKSFKEVLSVKSTRKAFVIIMIVFFFFQMSGINVVSFYSTMIFNEAGFVLQPSISSIIVAAVQVAATFLATAFSDKFGRRILMVASTGCMFLSLIGIGTYFMLRELNFYVDDITWLPLFSLSIFVIAFSFGMGPVAFILLGEFFLQEAKTYIAPISQVLSFLLSFTVGLAFPLLVETVGFGPTFYIFAGINFLATFFTFFFILETKGKSMAEIQIMLGK